MQPVLRDFVAWFGWFVFVSTVLLVGSHVVGSKLRARRRAAEEAVAKEPEKPAGGMKKVRQRV